MGTSDPAEYRVRCDEYYKELTLDRQCNGVLRIEDDEVTECCCERLALELAYGLNFILRDKMFFMEEGESEYPDVLPKILESDGMSARVCPFCGARVNPSE